MTGRERIMGILLNAVIKGYSLNTRVDLEKLTDHLVSEGVSVRPTGKWIRMWQQYCCSNCRHVIGMRSDEALYGKIEFCGEAYCYWCGSHNRLEER